MAGQSAVMAKGPLDQLAGTYFEEIALPILKDAGYCVDKWDCRKKEIFFCVSGKHLACQYYSITDKKVILKIVTNTLQTDYPIRSLGFYEKSREAHNFIENPIFMYINKTAEPLWGK